MSLPSTLVLVFDVLHDHVRSASIADVAVGLAAIWALRAAFQATGKKSRTTKLRGPKSNNLLFGVSKELFESTDMGGMFEAWSKEYGVAYEIPMICGEKRIELCDPRAAAHFFSKDTWSYVGIKGMKVAVARRMGKGLSYGEGESHRRQRRTMGPSFNSTAIRKLTPAVHKAIDKVKATWEASIEANGGDSVVLDVQKWMNYVSLDAFGIAGFSYDFNSLNGKPNPMISVLDSFADGMPQSAFSVAVAVLILFFPIAMHIPTQRNQMFDRLHKRMTELCDALIDNANANRDASEHASTINLLLRAEEEDSGQRISREEFTQATLQQLRTLLIASYETTAMTMTWALLELARHPNIQTKLREELVSFGGEPSYDQLTNDLPYLDAVVQEILRLHPSVPELTREAAEDDVIPLLDPVQTKSGEFVDSIVVERGTILSVPISCINRSEAIWGPDAKVFRPERWLEPDGITKKAQEVKGYRHLLSFGDGPRSCIGKTFALAEIKTVLSMAIRNFVLEMKDGPNTKVELSRGITLRPKVVGEEGIKVPLRIRHYKG
ncbi:cytochrome P450 [Pisolithus croceorrhizus]|nr:cytochrome P450 [Pisolithus croceorrhizus]KAI6120232.1 cytochrome P450 [Pisolithus croceorrhizus]KAI6169875.1 cytochrome P450 [Pisolithus thermaeus]